MSCLEHQRKGVSGALLLLILFSPAYAAKQEVYSEALPSDEGIYLYFSEILKDVESGMDRFLDEDPAAVNLTLSIEHRLELTEEESRLYSARGIESNVSYVLPPFTTLSSSTNTLASAQADFLENIHENTTEARDAVMRMSAAAHEANTSLSRIEEKELWNGTSELRFNVSGLRDKLEEAFDLIDYYSALLPTKEGSLFVVVSDRHPVLYEETIYVHARNTTPLFLYIDGSRHNISGGEKRHSFGELGRHLVYAESPGDGNLTKSNTVEVFVGKIPTYTTLSSKLGAFVNEEVEVRGLLSDYHGNPLNGSVAIEVDGEAEEVEARSGFFHLNVTRASEGYLNISAYYPGNETYRSSKANESIFFSRFTVSMIIIASKTSIVVNESVNFTGWIQGTAHPLPIHIYTNLYKGLLWGNPLLSGG